MRYVPFIHRDHDTGYGVSFPEFPGCVSVGDSVDEAIRHGREALAFHVERLSDEGEPIPPPRSIEAIKADPDIADWRRGADIVLIPLLLDRGSSRRVNISFDRRQLEAIDDEARLRRMTLSAFLATAARREIEATGSTRWPFGRRHARARRYTTIFGVFRPTARGTLPPLSASIRETSATSVRPASRTG